MPHKRPSEDFALALRLRDVQHRAAQAELAQARESEHARQQESDAADKGFNEVMHAWTGCIESADFDRLALQRLTTILGLRQSDVEKSRAQLEDAAIVSQQARDAQALAQARVSQVTRRLKMARRAERRSREETALTALEDANTLRAVRP